MSFLEEIKSLIRIQPEKLSIHLQSFIKEYINKFESDGIVLGLSGGIDSAVVAALCKRAVGSENILAIIMPERDSDKEHVDDAVSFAGALGINTKLIDISSYLDRFGIYDIFPIDKAPFSRKIRGSLIKKAWRFYERKTNETPFLAGMSGLKNKDFKSYLAKGNSYYRIKHRLRMILLYFYAELENRLVVGAANKSEYRTGFFVKHGCDHAADIMPLLNLYKTQVRELALYLDIPSKIIEKAPSPDIMPGITDEKAIGISYEKLDLILMSQEQGWSDSKIVEALNIDDKVVKYVKTLTVRSEHMREVYIPEGML